MERTIVKRNELDDTKQGQPFRICSLRRPWDIFAAGIAVGLVLSFCAPTAQAQTFTLLYSFMGGSDGGTPFSDLVIDTNGNLYGTTYRGGVGYGTVFEVNANGIETVLHRFTGGTAGANPDSGLTMDGAGNLYGTTTWGGAGGGTVFKLARSGSQWIFSILYSFTGGADGKNPDNGVILGLDGNLYGTTDNGGTTGGGVVFRLQPPSNCNSCFWTETVLYTFTGGADGGNPAGPVVQDAAGNLYGATQYGGSQGYGAVFKLDTNDHETVLYSFALGAGGAIPKAGLIRDTAGNLYGTTYTGGYLGCTINPITGHVGYCGAVFKLDSLEKETVLHAFRGLRGGGDGATPLAPLIADPQANLYGTTNSGGMQGGCRVGLLYQGCGTVFELYSGGGYKVLYEFPAGGQSGINPQAGLVRDANGIV